MKPSAAEPSLLVAFIIFALSASLDAATIASDNATNSPYADSDPDSWDDGDNGGVGFGAWDLTSSNGASGFAGFYVGETGLAGTDISFGLFAGNDSSAFAQADRAFSSSLTAGQTFSVDLGHTSTIGGEIGLNLLSGANVALTLKFKGGDSFWKLNDGGSDFDSGQDYAPNETLTFSLTYEGGTNYSYTFGDGSGSDFTASNTTFISSIDGVRFFSRNQGDNQNFGINNLSIVPEPTNALIGGLCALGLLHRRRSSTPLRRTAAA